MKRLNLGGMLVMIALLLATLVVGYMFGAASASHAEDTGDGNLDKLRRMLAMQGETQGSALVDRAFDLLHDQYFMEIDPDTRQKMLYAALEGMLQPLRKDPYADDFTNFYDPDFYKNLMAETEGKYAGVGVLMGVTADGVYPEVNTVFEKTPAEEAGLQVGDVITAVDGEDTYGMILPEVANKIKGEEGTKVKLKIYRPADGDIKVVELARREVTYSSVSKVEMLDNKVGYLKITNFADETGPDFRAGMEKLTGQGMKSLIIDLRDNPGGVLNAARDVADCFVEKGMIVQVDVRGDKTQNETLMADPSTKKYHVPIVIMVNANSASASEVLTSALRDYGLATVFGEKSFGKGVVQSLIPMELKSVESTDSKGAVKRDFKPDSAMAIVIGKYFTPKHVEIHKHGIEPDIWYNFQNQLVDDSKLKGFEDQLEAKRDEMAKIRTEATQYLRANDTVRNEAVKVASALGRGEKVEKRPELKPKEPAHDPLGLAPDNSHNDADKQKTTDKPTGKDEKPDTTPGK